MQTYTTPHPERDFNLVSVFCFHVFKNSTETDVSLILILQQTLRQIWYVNKKISNMLTFQLVFEYQGRW